jgi:Zn-dependent M28 family amino/carboxypeptidase
MNTRGDTLAREYIAKTFKDIGLKPLFKDFFQDVRLSKAGKDSVFSANVVAVCKGSDPLLRDEYIVIGSHFDHLGKGKNIYGRSTDTMGIYFGADDNASGVAMMLETAKRFAKHPSKRSVIFVAFSAEEMGLVGSQFFVEHLPAKVKITAMLNFDMVGKLHGGHLNVGGSQTSSEAEQIVNQFAQMYNLKIQFSPSGMGPSDHASFYAKSIPVFFIYTSADSTYHTHNDKPEYIDYEGMETISDFAFALASNIADRANNLTFQQTKDPERTVSKMRISLGIMPDHTGTTAGVKVQAVSKGKAAEKAGIKVGDLIIAIGNQDIKDLYQYMDALSAFKKGDQTKITVIRNNEKIILNTEF